VKSTTTAKSSSNIKETKKKNTFWKYLSISITIIAILLIIIIVKTTLENSPNNINTKESGEEFDLTVNSNVTNLIVIYDETCIICNEDAYASQIKANMIPDLQITKIEAGTEDAQMLINILGDSFLPIYIFDDKISQREDWEQMKSAFSNINYQENNFYILDAQAVPYKAVYNKIPVLDSTIVIGDENAPITLYEFSDYECEFCAIAQGNENLIQEFKKRYPNYTSPVDSVMEEYVKTGLVKYVYYNYPVSQNSPQASIAHNAALCANAQDSWLKYHNNLFEVREDWINSGKKEEKFIEYAVELGLNEEEFTTCLSEKTYDKQISSEIQLGILFGVQGTPSFFVEKNFIPGAQDYESFKQIIELELNR
jgi:protein-disulfide isomerase